MKNTYCKHCLRPIKQRQEKAIAEPRDRAWQPVWVDNDDSMVCEVWTDNNDDHEPGGELAFEFTSVDPFIEAGAGEAYYFTYQGKAYFLEKFSAGNHSGSELYDAETNEPTTIDHDAALHDALEVFEEQFGARWRSIAVPAIEAADNAAAADWKAYMEEQRA